MPPAKLTVANSLLAIIDWQERLFPVMDEARREYGLARAKDLVWMSRSLEIPVLTSEQYPRGLGPTVPELDVSDAIAKTSFSAMAEPAFAEAFSALHRSQVIVVGMETHICYSF